jgi:hypothetical protein
VFISIENSEHDRCVDFFNRPDDTFRFEEFRHDLEDRGRWTTVQYYSGVSSDPATAALEPAEWCVPWIQGAFVYRHLSPRRLFSPARGGGAQATLTARLPSLKWLANSRK